MHKGRLKEDKTIVLERTGRQVQLEMTFWKCYLDSRAPTVLNRKRGKCRSL